MPTRVESILRNIYYDVGHPAGYGSAWDLFAAARRKRKNITLQQVTRWLQAQDAYTLHRRIVRKFPRRKFISKGLNHIWQTDLVQMDALSPFNSGRRYLLTVIDVFSRQAYAKAIKTKRPEDVIKAFNEILREARTKPKFLQSDRGVEYLNYKFGAWLKQRSITLYHTNNTEIKCSLVERWHRTLKNKMYKYFTAKNTLHYLRVLPQLVDAYNRRKHRSLGMAPADVNAKNEKQVWRAQYGKYFEQLQKRFRFKINDSVRITKLKKAFQRGYSKGWQKEIFKIVDRLRTIPPTYKLCDKNNEILEGTFYEQELGKVSTL